MYLTKESVIETRLSVPFYVIVCNEISRILISMLNYQFLTL